MKSISNYFNSILNAPNLWAYKGFNSSANIFKKEECNAFIKDYMNSAGTESDFNEYTNILNERVIDDTRYQHIVFTFFLGLAIYDKCEIIREKIDTVFCSSEKYKSALQLHKEAPFAYLWFLVCLFHDLGYQYEKNSDIEKYTTLESFISKITKGGIPSLLSKLNGIPKYFTPYLIENYFNYRKNSMNKFDHGICGGLYMFETLCAIRRENKSKLSPQDNNGKWKDELEDIFSLASSIVLCHNIFLPNAKSINNYKEFQLDELIELSQAIAEKKYPFNMEEYPIFFLFCLVDSIEPIKIVKNVQYLDNIFMEFDNPHQSIAISTDLTCGCKDRILNNLKNLKDWLCDVDFDQKEIVSITFKN